MITAIVNSVFGNWVTSLLGSVAGVPEMISGYQEHNTSKIIGGLGMFLLGLAAKHK